jgi:hypothetical protein
VFAGIPDERDRYPDTHGLLAEEFMTSDEVRVSCTTFIGSTLGREAFVELQTATPRLRVYPDAFAVLNVLDQPASDEHRDRLLRRLLQKRPSRSVHALIVRLLFVGLLPHLKQIHANAWRLHGPCERWSEIYLALALATLPAEEGSDAPGLNALLQRVKNYVWSLENKIRSDRGFATVLPPEDIARLCTFPDVDLDTVLTRFASAVISTVGAEDAQLLWTVYDRGYKAVAREQGIKVKELRRRVHDLRRALGCSDSHHIG